MIEICKLNCETVFEHVKPVQGKVKPKMRIARYNVNTHSDRLLCFKRNTKCVSCGVEGTIFHLECHETGSNTRQPHLNLYGIDDNGNEVLMTKDHIMPKSKGGKNHLSNYQTMCSRCNQKKGDKV